jgi:hypothetical protein
VWGKQKTQSSLIYFLTQEQRFEIRRAQHIATRAKVVDYFTRHLRSMGCASSKVEGTSPSSSSSSAAVSKLNASSSPANDAKVKEKKKKNTTETKETEEETIKLFDATENHPTLVILDDSRANDVVYVYLQSFRLRHQQNATRAANNNNTRKGEEDKGPPPLSEYVCELMMRKRAGGRGSKDNSNSHSEAMVVVSETNDYRDEWISLGTKEFCCGVSGSLVPYLPRANSNMSKDKLMSSLMKPMNCAPVWPVPGAVELSTAFRVKVFPKDRVPEGSVVHVDVAAKEGVKRDESEQASNSKTVNALVEDARKTFLEENGRASPDLIKKSMDESGDTDDAEEIMESLLVDPRLDEIFNENKKSDGSLGCVLFTLSTLLPPRNDHKNAQKKSEEDNDTSSSTVAAEITTTTTKDSSTLGGRRDSGELVVLDSKVCYFDVGYRGVVSTLAAPKFTDCFESQGISLDSITCKHYCKEMKLDAKAIQAYTKGGFLSVLKLKKMLDPSLSPYVSPSGTPKRLSLDVFRKS